MALSLLDDFRRYNAILSAFVVMPHHIHFVGRIPENNSSDWLLDRIKSNSSRRVLRVLPARIESRFDEQRGLNRRQFWKAGYRSLVLTGRPMFTQKVNYTHRNPVDAGYVESRVDYKWSSASCWVNGLWTPDHGLELERCMDPFRHMEPYLDLSGDWD
jgi:REP element-mobilizing transposase RayT